MQENGDPPRAWSRPFLGLPLLCKRTFVCILPYPFKSDFYELEFLIIAFAKTNVLFKTIVT